MPKKHYPVQRTINVEQPAPVAADAVVSMSKALSKVNHRLYRQSRVYECSVQIDANVADATTVDVYALADTWYLKGALKLAKSAWDASNAEEIEMNNGKTARWNDFRVEAGLPTFGDTNPVLFQKSTLTANQITTGEFDFAQVVDQAGVSRTFTVGVASPTTYDIIGEYDDQSGTSADPEYPSTSPYTGLLPNLDAGAAEAISQFGNRPPYAAAGYGNSIWIKVGTLHLAAGRQRLSTGFFSAPLGLIALRGVGFLDQPDISVTVKGGDYKGVSAHNMLE